MSELRRRAIGLLARREHSRAELARKLAPHGTTEEIDSMLAGLECAGLLSDARFAESYVRSNAARLGAARLCQALRTKGVAADLIEAQVAVLPDEIERARAVWSRKFGIQPADAHEWAKQARFLQSRGFATGVIRQLLKDLSE